MGSYRGGLYRWDVETGYQAHYTSADGLPGNDVVGLALTGSGSKLIAAVDGGLATGTTSFADLTPPDGQRAWDLALESSSSNFWLATLAGALDLQEVVSPTLTFWYTMQAGGEGVVEVSTDDGATWQPAATITETTGWAPADVDLSAWAGLTAGLRLRHTGQTGATWAVDDFDVREVVLPVVHPLPFGDDMEAPTANWRAVNAWQPITGTAHSGASAWRGYAGDSALSLVDRLDLSETVSPTLTFWQQFALPEGSTGQVMASPDGGLTWQPVLTITAPILDWTQVEVDLSDYAGQEIGLAFHLSKVTTETVGGQTGYTGRPGNRYASRPTEVERAGVRDGVGALALVLPMLGVPVLAVVRRQREKRSACRWIWLAVTFLALACSPCNCCSLYPAPASPYASENRLQDVLGEVEPVVLAEREPMLASVSPDGKWMLVLLKDSGPVLAIDLEHNQEYEVLPDKGSDGQWLNESYAVLRGGSYCTYLA